MTFHELLVDLTALRAQALTGDAAEATRRIENLQWILQAMLERLCNLEPVG